MPQGHVESINPINYTAIDLLERLGNNNPSQQQIDLLEFLLLLAIRPNKFNLQMLEANIGENVIIRDLLKSFQRRQYVA